MRTPSQTLTFATDRGTPGQDWECEVFISVFDLRKGFYHVPMKEEDKEKTAFIVHNGFTSMPFGLKGAPATFQRLMDVLLDGTHLYAAAYMDDLPTCRKHGKTTYNM